jgi:hypothetical protein
MKTNDELTPQAVEAAKTWLRQWDWGQIIIERSELGDLGEWLRMVHGLQNTLEGPDRAIGRRDDGPSCDTASAETQPPTTQSG